MQTGSSEESSLDKASMYLMQCLAKINSEIRAQFTEDAKNVGGDDSRKWSKILE